MGHYIFWSDAERKADTFAARMERHVANGAGGTRAAKHGRNGRSLANGRRAA
jgi:hypothetical protein